MPDGAPAFDQALRRVARAVDEREIPGGVIAIGHHGTTLECWATGRLDTTSGSSRPVTVDSVFDLASLTKVVATMPLVLALVGAGLLGLDDPTSTYLPRFAGETDVPVTVRHLLAHTSGLPAGRQFFRWCSSPSELREALYSTELEARPGSAVVYSDLGFLALGDIAEAVTAKPLDVAVAELVTGPIGMTRTQFGPLARSAGEVAATEVREDGSPWVGTVHDENARLLGGVAGHAGLFSTAGDLARFCKWWVSAEDGPVPRDLRLMATCCQTAGLAGQRGLGWVRAGDTASFLGERWPPTAVCHTGFTGTSLALDPASGAWTVLLTNAVNLGRARGGIGALRREVHAAIADAIAGSGGWPSPSGSLGDDGSPA